MAFLPSRGQRLCLLLSALFVLTVYAAFQFCVKYESYFSKNKFASSPLDDGRTRHDTEGISSLMELFHSSDYPDHRPVAVIIEEDVTPNLVPLMLHFHSVLGPGWPLILFTLEESWVMPISSPFRRLVAQGRIRIHFLPPDTRLRDSSSVSRFFTKSWLWEQLEHAQRVLIFQTDSIICSNAGITIDKFLEYDFLGAPIDPIHGQGYNGGLSIRNPRLFLNITRSTDFVSSGTEFEDQWFFAEARSRVNSHGVKLPDVEVAKQFAVESIYYKNPLGYHQPQRWQDPHMSEIQLWCPEVGMLIGRRAV